MKTIILPGYSFHNKSWADETAKSLNSSGIISQVHNWEHWETEGRMSIKKEINRILGEIGIDEINILAKSVGVMVALNLVPIIKDNVSKIILCGIASVKGDDRSNLVKKLTSEISLNNVLCIQNEKDRFVPFKEAEKFYHGVNTKLKVVSKPRSDHNYPYSEDFIKFLK